MLDDPRCRLAIPLGGDRAFLPLPCHQSRQRRRQLARVGPDKFIRSDRDGFGTFRVVA
jgi:hypothetical protein